MIGAARTHVGKVRSVNQDTFVFEPEMGVFAVIDGMGGTQAGEVAADLTRQVILEGAVREEDLRLPLNQANEKIYQRATRNPDERGMGCVATIARVDGPDLELAHVGDTRAYLASSAGCEQLTRDHTVVADIQEQQGLTETRAAQLPGQHQVTRDIGGRLQTDLSWIDPATIPFEAGDVLLLCSDGLSDLVGDKELFQLLGRARRERQDVEQLVSRLIEMALERGAHDNVTVVVVRRDKVSRRRPKRRKKPVVRRRPGKKAPGKKAPAAGSDTDQVKDMTRVAMTAERPGGFRRFLRRLGCAVVLALVFAFAFTLGWVVRPWWPLVNATAARSLGDGGLVQSANRGWRFVREGEAGLGGVFRRDADVTALGELLVDEDKTRTRIAENAVVTLRGARFQFPPRPATWEIHLGPGSRLVLQQVSIRSSLLTIKVLFEDDRGRLVFEDCHLDVAKLQARGPERARIAVSGGAFHQRSGRDSPDSDGPGFVGVMHPDPPQYVE